MGDFPYEGRYWYIESKIELFFKAFKIRNFTNRSALDNQKFANLVPSIRAVLFSFLPFGN